MTKFIGLENHLKAIKDEFIDISTNVNAVIFTKDIALKASILWSPISIF